MAEQCRRLTVLYPDLAIRQRSFECVLTNDTWFDPTYDRTKRLKIRDDPKGRACWLWLCLLLWFACFRARLGESSMDSILFNPAVYVRA